MRIRNKLLISITVILSLVFILGLYYYKSLVSIRDRLLLLESIDDLDVGISEMRRAEKNYLIYHDQASAEEFLSQIASTRSEIRKKSEELITLEGKSFINNLIRDFNQYSETATRLVDTGGRDVDTDRIREQGHALYNYSRGIVHAQREQIDRLLKLSSRVLLFSLFFVLFVGLVGAMVITKSIVGPLRRIEKATNEVSEGNFVPIKRIDSSDEVGHLARAFNHMVLQIEKHQEELVQAGKLASLGTLTSGVAHELDNPLNNISMMAQTMTDLYDSMGDQERKQLLEDIEHQCERAKDVVFNLLDFSRMKQEGRAQTHIEDVIRSSLTLIKNQLALSNIEWDLGLADDLPPITINANRIKQVLVNIFTNAIKAMPGGGTLSVKAGLIEDGEIIEIAVSDTGIGIPPAALPRIFDPFFTTSNVGYGTGLGLSVSYGIVKSHGGAILVESEKGNGSTFRVRLPVKREETANDGGEARYGKEEDSGG